MSTSTSQVKLSSRKGTRNKRKNEERGRRIQRILVTTLIISLFINLMVIIRNFLGSEASSKPRQHETHFHKVATQTPNLPLISMLRRHDKVNDEVRMKMEEILYSTWHYPHIHIVNTRFMQFQPHLLNLLQARLKLFQTFCLPSMILQCGTVEPPKVDDSMKEMYKEIFENTSLQSQKNFDDEWPKIDNFLKVQNFLWIIKVDPNLNKTVIQQLQELLEPYPNFYLVGSNSNFGIGSKHGSWRDGQAGESILSLRTTSHSDGAGRIYSGDVRLLQLAHEYREDRIVIETRLDADDGIHKDYLSMIQNEAIRTFEIGDKNTVDENAGRIKWKYWCASDHVEWYSESNSVITLREQEKIDPSKATSIRTSPGSLIIPQRSGECITPGISLAIGIGIEEDEVQRYEHQKLVQKVLSQGDCGANSRRHCLEFVQMAHTIDENAKNPNIPKDITNAIAIRARTPTSAGMKNIAIKSSFLVETDHGMIDQKAQLMALWWEALNVSFGLTKEDAEKTNMFIQRHLIEIAIDNIKGQGTEGHSSKISSKDKLQAMVDLLMGDRRLIDHPTKAFQ